MAIVEKTAATLQQVLGPQIEELGRTTGVIQRHRKFSAVSLLRMLALNPAEETGRQAHRFPSHRAQLGLEVTAAAVEHRFNGRLVVFLLARFWSGSWSGRRPRPPQPIELLKKFTSVRLGDSSTLALPAELADQLPGCGGTLHTGPAALKIHLLWDFLTGSILRLGITPGRDSDATNPIAQELLLGGIAVAVRPGLLRPGPVGEHHAGRCVLDLPAAVRHVGFRRPGPAPGGAADLRGQSGPDRSMGRSCWGWPIACPAAWSRCGCLRRSPTGGGRTPTRRPRSMAACRRGSISTGRTGRSS